MKKFFIFFVLISTGFIFNISVQAEIQKERINFVLDQTKNIPWEANTGWLEIPTTGVKIRSYAFATSTILKYQFPVIITIEYDPNQVYVGNTFRIQVKLESTTPEKNTGLYLTGVYMPNSSYSLESRLGAEVKLQYNYQGEVSDLYAPVDMAINIQETFKTPLKNETQIGRDSVPYLNLVPEINTQTLSLKGKIAYGALKLASPALELFGGLKLEGKSVSGKVTSTGASLAKEVNYTWKNNGEVMDFWTTVHPQANLNNKVKISFSDLSYRFNLSKQMGMKLVIANLEASTPEDIWESVGEVLINGPAFYFEIPLVPGPPTSKVNSLPEKVNSKSFNVSWSGNSQAQSYTIQYRVYKPPSGYIPASWTGWIDWLVDTPATSGTFTVPAEGSEGNVYYFRSRARNANYQWEPEHLQPDTYTTIAFLFSISGKVKDNNNNPIPGAKVYISENTSTLTDSAGNYLLTGISPGNYSLKVEHSEFIFSFRSVSLENNLTNIDFTGTPLLPVSKANSYVNPLPNTQKNLSFTVSWTGTNAVAYDVQYKDGATGSWKDWVTNTTQTSKTFTGLNYHTYYFRCRAKDQNGIWEEYSNIPDTFTIISTSPGLRIIEKTPTSIKLEWDPPSYTQNFTRYEIHITTLPDQYFGSKNSTLYMALNSVSQTNWNVTNLQPNTKYYFVIAYVFNTVREYSEMQSVTTPGNIANSNVIPLPEEIHPPNTIPPNPIYNSFSVKWTGENATAYDIQYKVELSGEWKDWLVNTTKTEAVFPPEGLNLTNGKTYYFRSRAKDVNGLWEDYPQENEGDTHTKIVFSKATTFIIPLPKIQTKRTFQVSWNGINAVAYNVQYKKDKEGTWKNWVLNTSSKSKNFTGEDGHTYYFRCAGRDSNGIWAGYLPDNLVNTYTTISLENQTSENTSQTSSSQTGSFSEVEEKVDIVLLSLNFSTSMISENPIEITLKVKNSSSIEIPNCILKITAEDGFEEEREVFLKPNSIETFKFLWKTEKTGKCKIIAEIKTPEKIQEKNLRNNLLQKFIYLKNTKSNLKEEKFEKKIY